MPAIAAVNMFSQGIDSLIATVTKNFEAQVLLWKKQYVVAPGFGPMACLSSTGVNEQHIETIQKHYSYDVVDLPFMRQRMRVTSRSNTFNMHRFTVSASAEMNERLYNWCNGRMDLTLSALRQPIVYIAANITHAHEVIDRQAMRLGFEIGIEVQICTQVVGNSVLDALLD